MGKSNFGCGVTSEGYILDNDNSVAGSGTITFQFGNILNKSIQWNGTTSRFQFSDSLSVTNDLFVSGSAVFGATTAPTTTASVNGVFALRKNDVAITTPAAGTLINDLNTGGFSFVRLTGATNTFTLTGISGGTNGKQVILYNASTRNMTIGNNNTGSLLANRIITMTGGNVISTGESIYVFIYDSSQARWLCFSQRA